MKYILILITSLILAVLTYSLENHFETNGHLFTWIIAFLGILVLVITAFITRRNRMVNILKNGDSDSLIESTIEIASSIIELDF